MSSIAASFAPIHAQNNVNLGQLMGDYDQLKRLQAREELRRMKEIDHIYAGRTKSASIP